MLTPKSDYYIGLMSGTSADAIDAALVDFSSSFPKLLATLNLSLPVVLRQQIHHLAVSAEDEINQMGQLDTQLGELFAQAVRELLLIAGVGSNEVAAIGSHGQTIRHCPSLRFPFTYQIGDPNIIAAQTGIITVADFRRKDIALGGQGAPLTPAFHAQFYRDTTQDRVVLNLGGIANITYLPAGSEQMVGFDTGPANVLLDAWCQQHHGRAYDMNGDWARSGCVDRELLTNLLADSYFAKPYPKSTGTEHFNLAWLEQFSVQTLLPVDIQATLLELTAVSVAVTIKQLTPQAQVLLSGGGANNIFLIERLQACLGASYTCEPIDKQGDISADWLEAVAFAWLAKCCLANQPIDLCSVTGASRPAVLGVVCPA